MPSTLLCRWAIFYTGCRNEEHDKTYESPIKCKRTLEEGKSLDNPIPNALEAHIFDGLSVSEFIRAFMALK